MNVTLRIHRAMLMMLVLSACATREVTMTTKAGTEFRDCPAAEQCPVMVVIPAGKFIMGSPPTDPAIQKNEGPQHEVTIAQPFALGKYEVTKAEFAKYVASTGRTDLGNCGAENEPWSGKFDRDHDWQRVGGITQTDRDPVLCVNWHDAIDYTKWLSKQTGKTYRLPTEAEWEYAARAGTTTIRYWGDSEQVQCGYANGQADLAEKETEEQRRGGQGHSIAHCNDGYIGTAPVGSFKPNAFGLYDILGNTQEWVHDCSHRPEDYTGAPTDGSAWMTGACTSHVMRGGSWHGDPRRLRAAYRNSVPENNRSYVFGFRVARTL